MGVNTRARSDQLNAIAQEIGLRESIDPKHPPADNRPYIAEIMKRGQAHKETARVVWARWIRRAYGDLMPPSTWGGKRPGAGRKK